MKTVRGIYYNLKESEYTFQSSDYVGIKFYFSSQFYRNKFAVYYDEEIERFNQSLNNVYKNKFSIKMDILALIRFYVSIEKRGFYLEIDGVGCECVEDLRFDTIMTYKKSLDVLTN